MFSQNERTAAARPTPVVMTDSLMSTTCSKPAYRLKDALLDLQTGRAFEQRVGLAEGLTHTSRNQLVFSTLSNGADEKEKC